MKRCTRRWPAIEEMQLAALEGDSPRAERARHALATQLRELAQAAGRLSDRLSLRHFSMIDLDMHTVAA